MTSRNSNAGQDIRSLIERAGAAYGLGPMLSGRAAPDVPAIETTEYAPVAPAIRSAEVSAPKVVNAPLINRPIHVIDRERLSDAGFSIPGGPVTTTSEEFRIVKRKLLTARGASAREGRPAGGHFILVNSAHPGDGKSWCALNLALSLAAEQDFNVLLIDADTAKPSLSLTLGLPQQPGLIEALDDPAQDIEAMILQTDIPGLTFLPAGRQTSRDAELLASARTRRLLDHLVATDPNRIVIFDSPPALAASSAAVLASHVDQVLMVVRADRTTDSALREAVSLLAECPSIQLLLNGVQFSSTGRSYGTYYRREGEAA